MLQCRGAAVPTALKMSLHPPGFPPNAANIWEGGAEPGLLRFCSTPPRGNAKALDDAPFVLRRWCGRGRADGVYWGKPMKIDFSNIYLLEYRSPSSACPRCLCNHSVPGPQLLEHKAPTPCFRSCPKSPLYLQAAFAVFHQHTQTRQCKGLGRDLSGF